MEEVVKNDSLVGNPVVNKGEKNKDLNAFLEEYDPKEKMKNISEFDRISFDDVKSVEWKTFKFNREDGQVQVSRKAVATINGEKVVIPITVISSLKSINESEKIPGVIDVFTVNKSGEGLNTKYDVIPLKMKEE